MGEERVPFDTFLLIVLVDEVPVGTCYLNRGLGNLMQASKVDADHW